MTLDQILAIVIFLGMFICIILEKWHRYVSALAGAVLIMALVFRSLDGIMWVLNLKEIFHSSFWITSGLKEEASHGVNWQTVIFIAGMMVMIEGLTEVGFFRWLCLLVAKIVNYRVIPIVISFILMAGFMAMFIDSITVMLFLASVTIELARLLKFDPVPVIIAEIFAANTGGSATMCGDPPNIIIGTSFGFSFFDFLKNTGIIAWISMIAVVLYFFLVLRKQLSTHKTVEVEHIDHREHIRDYSLFRLFSFIFLFVVVLLVTHNTTHISVAFIGCIAAFLISVFGCKYFQIIWNGVDWKTLLFFIGLFICVGGLEHTGVLKLLASFIGTISKGNVFLVVSLILWVSAFASAIVDNIPFAATMVPVVFRLSQTGMPLETLSWSLALGTDIGGTATPIGASANVVGIGHAEREGYHVGWLRYCKYSLPGMILVMMICNILLYVIYF